MKYYYTPDQEKKLMQLVASLMQCLSPEQKNATYLLKRYLKDSEIASRFHVRDAMRAPAGVLMIAETLALANVSGWQENLAQNDLEYAVFSTPAFTHLEYGIQKSETQFQRIFQGKSLPAQKLVLEPLFKLQRQGKDEAYISYVNHRSSWREIIIDRGNQLPLELDIEAFYIQEGDRDIAQRTKIREFLK